MKNFKCSDNEELIKIFKNIHVKANENEYVLTLFLTSKRIVLLKDVNKELEYIDFLSSRLVDVPENLEVVFDLNYEEIDKITYNKGLNKITFKDNQNTLLLYCENICDIIKGE